MTSRVVCGDASDPDTWAGVPDKSIHVSVSSPPYWGLRSYLKPTDPLKPLELGCEKTPDEFVDRLVAVYRLLRPKLRDDGTVWVNLMGSFVSSPGQRKTTDKAGPKQRSNTGSPGAPSRYVPGYQPGDWVDTPGMFARAMQRDGWCWRSEIVWCKSMSFEPDYSGSCMPESPNGWRWERHRVKVAPSERARAGSAHVEAQNGVGKPQGARDGREFKDHASEYADCPGCPECDPHGGYILRKGSGRPTRSFEKLMMFSKGGDYFYDKQAVMEGSRYPDDRRKPFCPGQVDERGDGHARGGGEDTGRDSSGRNLRAFWSIAPGENDPKPCYMKLREDLPEDVKRKVMLKMVESGVL